MSNENVPEAPDKESELWEELEIARHDWLRKQAIMYSAYEKFLDAEKKLEAYYENEKDA